MFPRLLELGPVTVYSYGVLLAAAYLLALYYAVRRARAVRPRRRPRPRPGHLHHHLRPSSAAKLLLLIVDFDYFRQHPAEIWTLARSGGVFYGGLIVALRWSAFWYMRQAPAARLADRRRHRAGHRPGARRRPPRVPAGGLLLRQADDAAVGRHVHRPVRREQRRHAAPRGAAPDAALRRRRGVPDPPDSPAATEKSGGGAPGWTFWVYILLYADLPVRRSSSSAATRADSRWGSRRRSSSRWCSCRCRSS